MFRPGVFPLLASLLLVGACDDSGDIARECPPIIADSSRALATTPDQLLKNFTDSYVERSFPEYDDLLHQGFVFFFAPVDVSLSPMGQGFWDRSLEVGVTQRMFEGAEGIRPDGGVQPGIQSIDLDLTPLQPNWEDASDEGPEYVGTFKRRYEVDMTVDYTESNLISEVTGEQVFYVKLVPTAQECVGMVDVYQLIFWRDLGRPIGGSPSEVQIRGTDSPSWSRVKANYGG